MPINKDLINEKIQKGNYNNMMKNYNNMIQNQNTIQSPPSLEIKNPLNNIGLNTNLNQASDNFLNNNKLTTNSIPNSIVNGFNVNNNASASNTDILSLSNNFNSNGK